MGTRQVWLRARRGSIDRGRGTSTRAIAWLLTIAAIGLLPSPAAAHGALSFRVADQVYICQRNATGVLVSFKPPVTTDSGWSYLAFNLYGEADFGTVAYGWAGWQIFNGSPWFAASPGYPQLWSYGNQQWAAQITLHANRANTSSFGHRWGIYTYVQWADGHVTTDYQANVCAS